MWETRSVVAPGSSRLSGPRPVPECERDPTGSAPPTSQVRLGAAIARSSRGSRRGSSGCRPADRDERVVGLPIVGQCIPVVDQRWTGDRQSRRDDPNRHDEQHRNGEQQRYEVRSAGTALHGSPEAVKVDDERSWTSRRNTTVPHRVVHGLCSVVRSARACRFRAAGRLAPWSRRTLSRVRRHRRVPARGPARASSRTAVGRWSAVSRSTCSRCRRRCSSRRRPRPSAPLRELSRRRQAPLRLRRGRARRRALAVVLRARRPAPAAALVRVSALVAAALGVRGTMTGS